MIKTIERPFIRSIGQAHVDTSRGKFAYQIPWYEGYSKFRDSLALDLASPLYDPTNQSKIFDISGKGNDGTITGPTWVRLPSGVWVNQFDGTDDLITANGVTADGFFGGDSTIIAWAKLTDWSVDRSIFSAGKTDATHSYIFLGYVTATGLFVARSETAAPDEITVPSLKTYANDANWHLFSVSINAAGHIADFSINGVSQGSNVTVDHNHSGESVFYIGQLAWDSANVAPWKGQMGKVRVSSSLIIPPVYTHERHLFIN